MMRKTKIGRTTKNSDSPHEKRNSNRERIITGENITQRVMDRAYFIWEEKGRPNGQEWETWFQAEKEILKDFE